MAYACHATLLRQLNFQLAAKARTAWELRGDLNTALFQRVMQSRHHLRLIVSLEDENGMLISHDQGTAFVMPFYPSIEGSGAHQAWYAWSLLMASLFRLELHWLGRGAHSPVLSRGGAAGDDGPTDRQGLGYSLSNPPL